MRIIDLIKKWPLAACALVALSSSILTLWLVMATPAWLQTIDRWQTLIAGTVALIAALIGARVVYNANTENMLQDRRAGLIPILYKTTNELRALLAFVQNYKDIGEVEFKSEQQREALLNFMQENLSDICLEGIEVELNVFGFHRAALNVANINLCKENLEIGIKYKQVPKPDLIPALGVEAQSVWEWACKSQVTEQLSDMETVYIQAAAGQFSDFSKNALANELKRLDPHSN